MKQLQPKGDWRKLWGWTLGFFPLRRRNQSGILDGWWGRGGGEEAALSSWLEESLGPVRGAEGAAAGLGESQAFSVLNFFFSLGD